MIKLEIVEGALHEGEMGYETQQRFLNLFQICMNLQIRKASTYGEAWRDQGWAGNVSRVLSKASRVRQMLWRTDPINDADETVLDTLEDLINLSGFAIFNLQDKNRWGRNAG